MIPTEMKPTIFRIYSSFNERIHIEVDSYRRILQYTSTLLHAIDKSKQEAMSFMLANTAETAC